MNADIAPSADQAPVRPPPLPETPVPPIPDVSNLGAGEASTTLAQFRTQLAAQRTKISTHGSALSEYSTDLSTVRNRMAEKRSELAMRRTGMAFQRTRFSADRTLMAVIRTSLSMIAFGFSIYQVLKKLVESGVITDSGATRHFGTALVALGVLMLIGGILYHVAFMVELRETREAMRVAGLVHARSGYPVSLTLLTALALLVLGLVVVASIMFQVGPLR